jgi:septum site-determining protein MinC
MAAIPDYEQAGELKIGQVGIANLRVRTLDVARLALEMEGRVRSAPKLFDRAAVILDFGGLPDCPDAGTVKELVRALREAGVLPVGIAYGTTEIEALSRDAGLPLLAKFRASYESANAATPVAAASAATPVGAAPAATRSATTPAKPVERGIAAETAPTVAPGTKTDAQAGMMQLAPVRSGQQVYAQNRDLTVCAMVGAGAEVIADGSIHIYGALRGRALAGASGQESARIFCREFNAELVAVAGTYKVLEEIPKNLIGKAVQVRLENGKLLIEELA